MKKIFITIMLAIVTNLQAQETFGIEQRNGQYYQVEKGKEKLLPYTQIAPFFEYRAVVKINGKYGYINPQAQLISPAKYTQALSFVRGFAVVKIDDKYGIINIDGKEVIPVEYSDIKRGENTFIVKKDNLWGLVDTSNHTILPIEYTNIRYFDFSLLGAMKDEKLIIFNTKGEIVFEPHNLYNVMPLSPNLFVGLADNKLHFFAPKGKKLATYDGGNFLNTRTCVSVKQNNLWGIISTNDAHIMVPLQYAEPFQQLTSPQHEPIYLAAKLNNHWGVIDLNNNPLTPFEYDAINPFLGNVIKAKKADKWALFEIKDKKFTPLTSSQYETITLAFGEIIIAKKESKYGLLDIKGAPLTSFKYDAIGLEGVLNKKRGGNNIESTYIAAQQNGLWGVVDLNDKILLPFEYEAINPINNEVFAAKKQGKWAMVNFNGKILSPFKYNRIEKGFYPQRLRAHIDNKIEYLDTEGNVYEKEKME